MACTEKCRKPTPRQAHCTVCHKTFTGVTWFDLHRVGGACKEIEGLVEKDGLWATEESHRFRQIQREKMDRLNGKLP